MPANQEPSIFNLEEIGPCEAVVSACQGLPVPFGVDTGSSKELNHIVSLCGQSWSSSPSTAHAFLICIFFAWTCRVVISRVFCSLGRLWSDPSLSDPVVRSLGSGVSLLCPLSPKMKGVTEVYREIWPCEEAAAAVGVAGEDSLISVP